MEEWRRRDPIPLFEKRLRDEGLTDVWELEAIETEIRAEIEEAVSFAENSEFPTFADLPTADDVELR